MVDQLVSVFDVVKNVSIGAVIALVLVTAFLISNTIKITIFSRKREIEIMRLVGASNLNIKIPFILEGLFLGLIGSIIPVLATTYGYVAIYKNFNGQMFSPFIKLIIPEPFICCSAFIAASCISFSAFTIAALYLSISSCFTFSCIPSNISCDTCSLLFLSYSAYIQQENNTHAKKEDKKKLILYSLLFFLNSGVIITFFVINI